MILMAAIKVRLIWQRLRIKLGDEIGKKALRAQEKGERIFGIHIPFLLEEDFIPQDFARQTYIGMLGNYDFKNDVIQIYSKALKDLCKRYSINFDSAFLHIFCHELGHAREARIFEEASIFPYRFKIIPTQMRIMLGSRSYELNNIRIGRKDFYEVFMFGVRDYGIEKELKKYGIENPLPKISVWALQNIQKNGLTEEQRNRLVIELLLLLPYYVCVYAHGRLTESEREFMEGYFKDLIGDKWKFALKTMNNLEFGSPKKYVSVVCKLFERVLELHVFLGWEKNKELFRRYKTIPQFWSKNSYQVFYLCP